MAKVIIEMDFVFDGFDNADDTEKFNAIEEVLKTGAEAMNTDIKIHSIEIKNKR